MWQATRIVEFIHASHFVIENVSHSLSPPFCENFPIDLLILLSFSFYHLCTEHPSRAYVARLLLLLLMSLSLSLLLNAIYFVRLFQYIEQCNDICDQYLFAYQHYHHLPIAKSRLEYPIRTNTHIIDWDFHRCINSICMHCIWYGNRIKTSYIGTITTASTSSTARFTIW